jgi:hypothetical protein
MFHRLKTAKKLSSGERHPPHAQPNWLKSAHPELGSAARSMKGNPLPALRYWKFLISFLWPAEDEC